jgi:hypothetical protein
VPDAPAAERASVECGATLVRSAPSLVVLQTPAGQPFCLFHDARPAHRRPPAPSWPAVGRSLADQLSLDIRHALYETECAFWAARTGWEHVPGGSAEFGRLNPPAEPPVQLLLHRLGPDDDAGARAHLDMSAGDPTREVARHLSLGATVVADFGRWTTLRGPAGLVYCVTHRRPPAAGVS